MRAEIRRIHRELGRTTIYVTHDQDEALSLADRIVVMKDGVMQQVADPEHVYAQPANLHVARFMGYRNEIELNVGARNGNQVTLEGQGLGLEGIAMQELAGPRVSVAIRPEDLSVGRAASGDLLTVQSSSGLMSISSHDEESHARVATRFATDTLEAMRHPIEAHEISVHVRHGLLCGFIRTSFIE